MVCYELLTPFVIVKILRGMDLLSGLYENTAPEQESVMVRGIRVRRLMLKKSLRYYEQAISVFAGRQLAGRLEGIEGNDTIVSIRRRLAPEPDPVHGRSGPDIFEQQWIDLAGMVAPGPAVDDLLAGIREGRYKDLEQIRVALKEIHDTFELYTWNYTTGLLSAKYGIDIATVEAGQLIRLIERWESDAIRLNKMILHDAAREFERGSRIGYGIDGDETVRDEDFNAVRGTLEENSFIGTIRTGIGEIEKKASRLKKLLEKL